MELHDLFNPVDAYILTGSTQKNAGKLLGKLVNVYTQESGFPSLNEADIAIIGATEDRLAVSNEGCGEAADSFREYFYKLYSGSFNPRIIDLGNLIRGNSPEDSYFALSTTIEILLEQKVVPVIVGGSQDLTAAIYKAYKNRRQIVNVSAVDNRFDLGELEDRLNSHSYLSHIILQKPNYLFNFTNIGYQTHFVDPEAIELMHNLFFDICRLGSARANLAETEPLVRNADIVTFDLSAVRQSDAPGNGNASPNGLYAEEACQLARFAGMSDKLSSIGFFEINPRFDHNGQTAHLTAQLVWYFIEGFYHRNIQHPVSQPDDFTKYSVQVSGFDDGIIFYRSKQTERWWMEVKCDENTREMYYNQYIIPCSFSDYQLACRNEIPDRWWQAYQKLM